MHEVVFVVGPTGAGKSNWALNEAARVGGVIVNADSIQIYKHLDIGSAKPTKEDQARVPHFLYSHIDPQDEFTAGDYRRAAWAVLEEQAPLRPVFVVGGSGFYLQALEKGLYEVGPIPAVIEEKVRVIKEAQQLFEELKKVDPQSATKIGPNDHYRLQRALEVVLTEGRTMGEIRESFATSGQRLQEKFPLRKVGIGCERSILRARVARRTEDILRQGFVQEVEGLLRRGYRGTKALASVGYREVVSHLDGRLHGKDLPDAILTSTMQLAKRQMTWFKRDSEILWQK
jgi:tRNA dimethylallyltransferase